MAAIHSPDSIRQSGPRSLAVGLVLVTMLATPAVRAGRAAGIYKLAGTPDGNGQFLVDDGLDVYRNGVRIHTDGIAGADMRGPIPFSADIGDTLRFVVNDTYGTCAYLGDLYLIDPQGRSTLASAEYQGGCSNPPGDQGEPYEKTFVIPDLAVTGPPFTATLLPGSAWAGVVRGPGGGFYGVTYDGEKAPSGADKGTVYHVSADLSQVTTLHEFSGADGMTPYPELSLAGEVFYGLTNLGGQGGTGTIFKLDPAIPSVTTVRDLGSSAPQYPRTPLLKVGPYLYGGSNLAGGSVIFRARTDGSELKVLREMTGTDGTAPGGLTIGPGGLLYGAAEFGGQAGCWFIPWDGCGTIFRFSTSLDADGHPEVFEVIHTFTSSGTGFPNRKLVVGSDGRLYGTTYGTVFTLNPDGTDYKVIYTVMQGTSQIFSPPIEGLDGRIYVSQYDGGMYGVGSVYSMRKDGSDVLVLATFSKQAGQPNGPYGELFQDSPGAIYGTTEYNYDLTSPEPVGTVFVIRDVNQAGWLASKDIGAAGGTVETADGAVQVIVPPGALAQTTTITITGGIGASTFGVGTPRTRASVVELGPSGTTFAQPVTVRIQWPDVNPPDGFVDGLGIDERLLRVYQDGPAITPQCQALLAPPNACPTCCDTAANRWEIAVTGFSEFVIASDELFRDDFEVGDVRAWSGLAPSTPPTSGQLVFTEVMPLPDGSDVAREWIELANVSSGVLDLTGCVLASGAASHTIGALLAGPNQVLVLARVADHLANGGLTVSYVYDTVSLPSSTDVSTALTLSCGGVVMDAITWTAATAGASRQLDPGHLDAIANDDPGVWCDGTSIYGSGGTGTPGVPNPLACTD